MPEGRIPLAQAATYLACAPKSNAAYLAVNTALEDVKQGRTLPVPKYLQSGPKPDKGDTKYRYAHDGEGHFVDQQYVPTDKVYYQPSDQGYEETIRKRIEHWNARRKKK
jgi:putative ATPase